MYARMATTAIAPAGSIVRYSRCVSTTTASAPRTRQTAPAQALAFRSRKRLGFDLLILEVFQRAWMEWKLICLVEPGRRELAQVRRDGDHLGFVRLHCLDGLVHHVVGHLGVGEQDVVYGIDLHRFFDADED